MRSSLSDPASPSTLNSHGVTVSLMLAERADAGLWLQLPNPDDSDEVLQALHDTVPALREIFRSLNEDEPTLEISKVEYLLEAGGAAVSFDDLIAGLSEHVDALTRVLEEADRVFQTS